VSKRDGWARLDVIDDGPGIAGEDLPHVFERLYVSRHRPQRKEAGSGLGLAIVRELVAAHGGAVEASAAPGGGASLSVLLPLAPVSAPS
jgi:signal transduction histidine kinase